MPIMSTRGSVSVRFANHLVPRRSAFDVYRVSAQVLFETPGRYTWICPPGVTSISVMCVGGGGGGGTWENTRAGANGGGGGGYTYMYNYPVTPGTGYTVQVGCGGNTPERLGTAYWDSQDNGVTNDLEGYSTIGGGGISSWFVDRSTCRGGGGMNGRTATISSGAYRTGIAYGGVTALGGGLSGGQKRGGYSDTAVNVSTFPPAFSGGGAAGTSTSQADSSGSGSAVANGSLSGGSTGGGGGGGAGYSFADTTTLADPGYNVSWSVFMNTYAVWNTSFSATITYTVYRTFTAPSTGTYYFRSSADNSMSLYVDSTLISGTTNFNVTPSPVSVTLSAGTYLLTFVVYNNESFGGFAVTISNSSDTLIWDTRTNASDPIVNQPRYTAGGGGGIGIYGITATAPGSGAAGSIATLSTAATGGGGGSGGQAGYAGEDITSQSGTLNPSNGGKYGGGGGGGKKYNGYGSYGGHGVVRILLDSGSAYPSTNTSDIYTTTTVAKSSGSYRLITQSSFFETPGRYTWIVPAGVTSISVMAVGGGGGGGTWGGTNRGGAGGGGGGGYAYMYDYPVTPGTGYTIQVGAGGNTPERHSTQYWDNADNGITNDKGGSAPSGSAYSVIGGGGIASWFANASVCRGGGGMNGQPSNNYTTIYASDSAYGGYYTLGAGLSGGGMYGGISKEAFHGPSDPPDFSGGGGAGTRTSASFNTTGYGGGEGGNGYSAASTGGGGGGGGGYATIGPSTTRISAGGGGGIGLYGITATAPGSGAGGAAGTAGAGGGGGGGGSGGQSGYGGEDFTVSATVTASNGGKYGGGGGAGKIYNGRGSYGGHGGVRIIWGSGRAYPSTGTESTATSVTIPIAPPNTYQIPSFSGYTTPGTYTWICPEGVTSVYVVCIGGGGSGSYGNGTGGYLTGGGGGGGGGGLGYKNNITVVPGNSYTVVVGAGGASVAYNTSGNNGGDSYFIDATTVKGGGGSAGTPPTNRNAPGGTYVGDGGGNGGNGGNCNGYGVTGGGGGAGGYAGNGGAGASAGGSFSNAGDGGGGAGGSSFANPATYYGSGGGGGVGIVGQGPSGAGRSGGQLGGYGGSGGANGTNGGVGPGSNYTAGPGGAYGGGGGGATNGGYGETSGAGGNGAVQIFWSDGTFPLSVALYRSVTF